MKNLQRDLKTAKRRIKFLLHPDNAHIAKVRTVVKLEREIQFLEAAIKEEKKA